MRYNFLALIQFIWINLLLRKFQKDLLARIKIRQRNKDQEIGSYKIK